MRRRTMRAVVLGLLLLGLPAPAGAATISRENRPGTGLAIYYDGDAQRDQFTASTGPMTTVVFTQDVGGEAALTAGPGCNQLPLQGIRTVVSCPGMISIKVATAGGDDSIKGFSTTGGFCGLTVSAGDGSDTVEGSASACSDTIDGGPGPDTINAFGGDDKITGGPDEDTIDPGLGADDIDGGDGDDTVLYPRGAGQGVRVTFDDQDDDGQAGEKDNVHSNVENATGGDGNDTLIGNGRGNRLIGGAGADELVGGPNADRLAGGSGNDLIDAGDREPDEVECGDGSDTATIDGRDNPVRNCETVTNVDKDGDFSKVGQDCDDNNPSIHPGAPEIPENGIDEDCDGQDAGNFDRDGDGITRPLDCDDNNPAIRPGVAEIPGNAIDENCDRVIAPAPRITSGVVNKWLAYRRYTMVVRLTVRDAPVGAVAEVRCDGRGCPRGVKRRRSTGGKELRFADHFRGRKLRVGATIEIRILMPGTIGKIVRYRMRPSRIPKATILCLPPAARNPQACAPGT